MSNAVHACSTERHEPLSEKGELHIISTNVSSNLAEKNVTSECNWCNNWPVNVEIIWSLKKVEKIAGAGCASCWK